MYEQLQQMIRMGFGVTHGKEHFFQMIFLKPEEQIWLMGNLFTTGGFGIVQDGTKYSAFWQNGTFSFARGNTAKDSMERYSFAKILEEVQRMKQEGIFLTAEEYRNCLRYFYSYAADQIHFLPNEVKEQITMEKKLSVLTKQVHDPEFLKQILPVVERLQKEIQKRRQHRMLTEILYAVKFLLQVNDTEISESFTYEPSRIFVTEDEVMECLKAGSGFEWGKYRIWSYGKDDPREFANFLKTEYGTGGRNAIVSGDFFSQEDHDSTGIKLTKAGDVRKISWLEASKKIQYLIRTDSYFTKEEKEQIPVYERHVLAGQIQVFYSRLPLSATRPWEGDYIDANKELMNLLADVRKLHQLIDQMERVLPDVPEGLLEGKTAILEQLKAYGADTPKPAEHKPVSLPDDPGIQMSIFDFL